MSEHDEAAPESPPPRPKIRAEQSIDVNKSICWKAGGYVASDPAGLAEKLGVPESDLDLQTDMEAYAAEQKRLRRPRSRIAKSDIPW